MSLQFVMRMKACLSGAALVASLAAAPAFAEDGPFTQFAGPWAGNGVITASNGVSERIRCRVHYYVAQQGRDLNQQLRCASDSYHFDVNSALLDVGAGNIVGNWTETNRNAVGKVRGQVDGNVVNAEVVGTGFTAALTVALRGDRQSVKIVPTGSDIASVTIDLRRQ
ncbi:MAG TPA: hypothetical protein VKU03_01210 [Roseiarcus sp.]|nr:hypothetical protein [Roseiarcus sp.]